jgi:hypothetical protein
MRGIKNAYLQPPSKDNLIPRRVKIQLNSTKVVIKMIPDRVLEPEATNKKERLKWHLKKK